jgi:hypothetical protein
MTQLSRSISPVHIKFYKFIFHIISKLIKTSKNYNAKLSEANAAKQIVTQGINDTSGLIFKLNQTKLTNGSLISDLQKRISNNDNSIKSIFSQLIINNNMIFKESLITNNYCYSIQLLSNIDNEKESIYLNASSNTDNYLNIFFDKLFKFSMFKVWSK